MWGKLVVMWKGGDQAIDFLGKHRLFLTTEGTEITEILSTICGLQFW